MKSCPKCVRVFPDDAAFCPVDGTALVFASQVPVAPSADDQRLGKRLCNRYEVRRVVADGGMGRVYEGIDKEKNTRVAIKVLHDDVARDDVSLARFKREYEISSVLPHDHIVDVLDFQRDEQAGVWLLVMEFLDGEELRVVLKREKALHPARVIRMLAQVALGLDQAHARSFVHRDLKPDNLFLCGTREGDVVKILDFGSVKDKNKDAKKLTVLGTTIGSPYYMAPEQAQGLETLDARADVFALAAITYECLAGAVPFNGSNGPSILLAILTKDPEPPSLKGKDLPFPPPATMDDVLEEALAKNPNIRTATVGSLADAVGRAYGLAGEHKTWAAMREQDLVAQVEEARKRGPQSAMAQGDPFAAKDPFAAPDPFAAGSGRPGPGSAPPPAQAPDAAPTPSIDREAARAMDQAFNATRAAEIEQAVAGMPPGRPGWVIPVVIVGVLVVLGGIAAVALR
jgi:tRNA A-37 threonylcarbamoyl transferase component Bud32